jgi:YVTN family beta-propeller protein
MSSIDMFSRHGIITGSAPVDLAVNPSTNTIYVSNSASNTISIIDGKNDEVIKNITLSTSPNNIEFDPITNNVYISNTDNDTVSIIDGKTNALINNITVGDSPFGIAVDPYVLQPSSFVFVTNGGSNNTSIIYPNSGLTSIPVNLSPFGVAIHPITKTLYVANSGSGTISAIRYHISERGAFVSENTEDIYLGTGSVPTAIAVNPSTNTIYVSNSASNTVSVINGTTNSLVTGITFYMNPPFAGYVECNKESVPPNTYTRININAKCQAHATSGFIFDLWSRRKIGSKLINVTSSGPVSILSDIPFISWFNGSSDRISYPDSDFNTNIPNLMNISEHVPTFEMAMNANFKPSAPIIEQYGTITSLSILVISTTLGFLISGKKKFSKMMEKLDELKIDDGDIIQVDASVIVGILILLTVASDKSSLGITPAVIWGTTAIIIIPFAISALAIISKSHRVGISLMIVGFANLLVAITLLTIAISYV